MKRGRTKGIPFTPEAWMMQYGKEGATFYSEKKDRHLTAIATNYKRKITTERLTTVTTGKETPVAKSITKVTLL